MNTLLNKVAVVTGGSSGIGKAICMKFAEHGADIVVVSNDSSANDETEQAVSSIGRKCLTTTIDVSEKDAVGKAAEKILAKFGRVDLLANCAGIMGERLPIFMSNSQDWRKTIEVNLFGVYHFIRAFLPYMIEQTSGRIINIASAGAKDPVGADSDYVASKCGVMGITKSVAKELGLFQVQGITVNAICPGVTDTPMVNSPQGIIQAAADLLRENNEKIKQERVLILNTQQRILEPEEIASMALFLASDDARGITGQSINVCGGWSFA